MSSASAQEKLRSWNSSGCVAGLVSVITALHNREQFIIQAMQSVLEQSYRPIEHIVVDDGSNDNSAMRVEEWIKKHTGIPCITFRLIRQENAGACAARNRGVRESKGEYIQCLDDDDIMYPSKLEKQVAYLVANQDVDVVACQLDYLREDLSFWCRSWLRGPNSGEEMHHYAAEEDILNLMPIYRRTVVGSVGGWREGLPFGQDFDFHIRLALSGGQFALLDSVLAGARTHDLYRLSGAVRFNRSRSAVQLDANLFQGAVDYALARGRCDANFRRLISRRLTSAAQVYFAKCMPARAQLCLQKGIEILGQSTPLKYKFCLNPVGACCACVLAAPMSLLGRVVAKVGRLSRNLRAF